MAAGGKCKYLLYVASIDALTNRRRRAANMYVAKAKKVITSLINRTQQGQGAIAVFDGKKCTLERHVVVTMVTKTWFKTEFKTGF